MSPLELPPLFKSFCLQSPLAPAVWRSCHSSSLSDGGVVEEEVVVVVVVVGGCVMCCDSGSQGWRAVTMRHHIAGLPGDEGSACQPCQEVLIGATRLAFTH